MEQQKSYLPIAHWSEDDRPREKLLQKGKANLSDAELVAILMGSGTRSMSAVDLAKAILNSVEGDLNKLAKLTVKDLTRFKGVGTAKAISIVSALELGRRRKETATPKTIKITTGQQAYEHMKPYLEDLQHEEFWIILLRNSNTVISTIQVSKGGVGGTIADPRIIFKHAIEALASFIILVHNHPSGNLKPSNADLQITKKLISGGNELSINVVDHIIYTENGYTSLLNEGYI